MKQQFTDQKKKAEIEKTKIQNPPRKKFRRLDLCLLLLLVLSLCYSYQYYCSWLLLGIV